MNPIRKTLMSLALLLVLLPLSAQERTETVYTFRFVPQRDMFYVPWSGNDAELARLEALVSEWRSRILDGEIPIHVDGHADNLAIAKIRSNRVKSELITCQGLTEACFITKNHADGGDSVTVRLAVPKEETTVQKDERRQTGQESREAQRQPAEAQRETGEARLVAGQVRADGKVGVHPETDVPAEATGTAAEEPAGTDGYTLSLRANLLRWATLTPDLGLEWRISPSWGILINGSWTSWSWNNKDRRYALWEVAPEVRYYIGKERRGYLGAMFKAGGFNYKLSATGRQGDLTGGGITGGYQLRLNKALSMDFNVGIGCLHADYEKYTVSDGVRVRAGKETKNWWGPVNAGVTLVWRIK